DVHDARGGERLDRQLALAQPQPVVTVPQHDAFAGRLVHQNDRELVLRVADDQVGDVDIAFRELGANAAAVLVRPRYADVFAAQAEARARAHRGRRLTAAQHAAIL